MPISIVPMTEEEIKKNEKRFPKPKKPKKKKPQNANKVNSGQKPKGLLANKTGGIVKRMGGGKTSKYRAKTGGIVSKKNGKQIGGGMIGFKKTSKYRAKGGLVKRMSGGKATKYRAKGGRVK